MKEIWKQIEAWLERWSPEARKSLRPGASPEAIATLEQSLGVTLPAQLRAYLELHDGQDVAAGRGLLDGWIFLSSDRIAASHQIVTDLLRTGNFKRKQAVNKDGAVKAEWWNERWIPFLEGPGGDMLCVDLDPAEGGTPGQIITFWHADKGRDARAPDLEGVLQAFVADLRDGKYSVDDTGGLEIA